MKFFLMTFSLFLSVVHAGDRESAYNAICEPMKFESDRTECMSKIRRYNYFDDRGLYFCKSLTFSSERVSCLGLIGNKRYEEFEMDNCLNQTFESRKLECLRDSGMFYRHH